MPKRKVRFGPTSAMIKRRSLLWKQVFSESRVLDRERICLRERFRGFRQVSTSRLGGKLKKERLRDFQLVCEAPPALLFSQSSVCLAGTE